jgi:hypothetical protein
MATSWRYRVLRHDGTELTTDLPHTVNSHSQTFGMVRGLWPPKSQIGLLNVPLIPPKGQTQAQSEWAGVNVEALYKQLRYGQRIERYTRATAWSATKAYNRNDVVVVSAVEYVCISPHTNHTPPNATYWALANPTFTGLIDKTPRDLKTFALEAQDSWFLHQKAESERKDYFQDTATNIIKYAITDWQLLYGDDFATQDTTIQDGSLAQYAQVQVPVSSVSWTPTMTGKTAWQQMTGMEAGRRYIMHNNAAYTTGQLVPSKIEGTFRINAPANAPLVTAGLIVGLNPSTGACQQIELGVDTTPGPGQLANLWLKFFSYSTWGTVSATQFSLFGANAGGIIAADGTSQADYQLTVLPKDAASGGFAGIRVLVQGQDIPGSTFLAPGLALTGAVGFYAYSANGGGTVKARDLYVFSRGNQMTLSAGFPVTTSILEMTFNQASGLEMMMLAANAADITLRKECRKDQDILDGIVGDFPPITGGPPVIKEQFQANSPGNLITAQEADNASIFATQLKVQAISRQGFPVLYAARNLQAIRDYGLWTRMENLEDISDFRTLSAAGDAAAKLSSDPATSRTIVFEDNASTVGLWRELSTIQLQAPHLDPALANSMRQIIGYEETEGSPQKSAHLDEYPASMALSDVSQLKTSIDNLIGSALTYRAQTTPGVTQVVDNPNNWTITTYGGSSGGGGTGLNWPVVGPSGSTPGGTATGGNMTLIGGGPIPSGITLPLTYTASDLPVIVSIPFNVYDHACNILAFATLGAQFASSEAYVTVQLHTGPDVNTVVNESQPTRMGSNQTLETGTAMIAPPFTSLAPGSYVAWITIKPTGAGTLVDAIGEIQIYCV